MKLELKVFLFLLTLKTSFSQQRRGRQLDLINGKDVTYSSERPVDVLKADKTELSPNRGYLPPKDEQEVPAAAAIDETIIKPAEHLHPHHHGRDLCSDPFHSFLCEVPKPRKRITGSLPDSLRAKYQEINGNFLGANSIPRPSKILAPPLEERILTTTVIATTYPSTLPTTEIPTTLAPTTIRTTTEERIPAPSNVKPIFASENQNLRAYLPPEVPQPTNVNEKVIIPQPAQDDPVVVKPDEDHHHPHHHGRDLCSDPFHSFLCAPLKKRVRITGALPNSLPLDAQNSFLESRKVRPTNIFQPLSPNVIPEPSNTVISREPLFENILRQPDPQNDYLPPRLVSTTTTTTTRRPTTTTRRPTTTTARRPEPIILNIPAPSNEIERAYLPPRPLEPRPSNVVSRVTSFTTTTTPKPTTTTTTRRPTTTSTTTRRPTTTTRRPTTTTTTTTTTQRPTAQPTNQIRSYLPPEDPSYDFAAAQNDIVTYVEPEIKHTHKDLCADPFHSFLCQVPKPRTRITGAFPSRLVPDTSNNIPKRIIAPTTTTRRPTTTTTRRPTTTTTTTTTRRPTTTTTTTQADRKIQEPTNQFDVILKPSPTELDEGYAYPQPAANQPEPTGYEYPKPSTGLPLNTGYDYPKPEAEFPQPTEEKGYTYPKPPVEFPPPTTEKEGYDYPKPDNGYSYPKPSNELPLPEKNGYGYPKPDVEFVLPSQRRNTFSRPDISGYGFRKRQIRINEYDTNPWIPIIPNKKNSVRVYYT